MSARANLASRCASITIAANSGRKSPFATSILVLLQPGVDDRYQEVRQRATVLQVQETPLLGRGDAVVAPHRHQLARRGRTLHAPVGQAGDRAANGRATLLPECGVEQWCLIATGIDTHHHL